MKITSITRTLGALAFAASTPLFAQQETVVFPEVPTPIPCAGKTPQEILSQGYVLIQKEPGNGAKEKEVGFAALTEETLAPFIMDVGPNDQAIYVFVDTKKRYTDLCVWKRVNDDTNAKTPDNDVVFLTFFGKPVK